eukprot:15343334-Ditylum_brightwellii.AAC.1
MSRGQSLPFSKLKQGSLSADSTTHTSYAPPQQTLHQPSTSSLYWTPKLYNCQDSSKGNALTVYEQAGIDHGTQTMPHLKLCLDNVAEDMFPKKAGQTQ